METCQIQEGAAIYYLTFTVVEWLPVFIAEEPCLIRRKGLVLDGTAWRFSLAAYWLLDPPGERDVRLTAVSPVGGYGRGSRFTISLPHDGVDYLPEKPR